MTEIRHFPTRLAAFASLLSLLAALLLAGPVAATVENAVGDGATANEEVSCAEAVAALQEQNRELSADLRRIHRELAALREELAHPGMKEAFSGIGYILGLFGVAFFFMGRKNQRGG